ncbi:hypothetical protein EMIT0158MI4_160060 [Burkholderia ambifaria]
MKADRKTYALTPQKIFLTSPDGFPPAAR